MIHNVIDNILNNPYISVASPLDKLNKQQQEKHKQDAQQQQHTCSFA
jgi:hypothetical protein